MAQVRIPVISVFLTVAVVAVSSFAASVRPTKAKGRAPCPEQKFYDHGTELCEPCIGICKYANITNTVEQCRRLCPAMYAQLSNSQEHAELTPLSLGESNDQSATTISFTGPSIALIAGIIAGVVLISFLIILGAFVCKRVQDNAEQNLGGGQQGSGSAERDSNRNRQGYSPAGMQEENGEHADNEGQRGAPQGKGLRNYCDPRHWFAPEVPAEETESGQQGTQEIALLGNSQGSVVPDLSQAPKTVITTPIYKPSGSMKSTVTRI